MNKTKTCPECGAGWQDDTTCQDYFHQMLFWESENSGYGEVHHLMVLCYYLQHPGLYSPDGLEVAKKLLKEFVLDGFSPQAARRRMLSEFNSGPDKWKITATEDTKGSYLGQISWQMTAADIIKGGSYSYCENIRVWSQAIMETLKETGNY